MYMTNIANDKVPQQLIPHVLKAINTLWAEMKIICKHIAVKLIEPMRGGNKPIDSSRAAILQPTGPGRCAGVGKKHSWETAATAGVTEMAAAATMSTAPRSIRVLHASSSFLLLVLEPLRPRKIDEENCAWEHDNADTCSHLPIDISKGRDGMVLEGNMCSRLRNQKHGWVRFLYS